MPTVDVPQKPITRVRFPLDIKRARRRWVGDFPLSIRHRRTDQPAPCACVGGQLCLLAKRVEAIGNDGLGQWNWHKIGTVTQRNQSTRVSCSQLEMRLKSTTYESSPVNARR